MAAEIIGMVSANWIKTAQVYDLSRAQIENMRAAFSLTTTRRNK